MTTADKEAQIDLSGIGKQLGGVGESIGNWYGGLGDETRSALTRGLIGAGTGATALGLGHALSSRDDEERGKWKSKALLGALLGGGGAAALPYGVDMLRGAVKLPGEVEAGPLENASTAALGGALGNAGAVGGAAIGGLGASRLYKNQLSVSGANAGKLLDRMPDRGRAKQLRKTYGLGKDKSFAGLKPGALKDLMGAATDQRYSNFRDNPFKMKDITVGKGTGGEFYMKRPALAGSRGFRRGVANVRDPRLKALMLMLGGAGLGAGVHKSVEGSL